MPAAVMTRDLATTFRLVCTCVHTLGYTHVCADAYTHACTHVHMHAYTRVGAHAYARGRTHVDTHDIDHNYIGP